MQEITTLISTGGFPVGVACFLIVKFQKAIEQNTEAITKLTVLIDERLKEK